MRKINKDDILYFFSGLFKKRRGVTCPYCKSSPVVYAKKYGVIDICRCGGCHLFFVDPIYVPGSGLKEFYDESYSSDATVMPGKDELELMKSSNFKMSEKDCDKRLNVLRKLTTGDRLLEFGSSWGYFLFQAKGHGFDPLGVEISSKRAEFGRRYLGVDILPDMDSADKKFDLIYSAHVLEHLTDLSGIFDTFYKKLLPGGALVIEVPNFDPEVRGKAVHSVIGKVHPLGFSRHFFEKNLFKHGFLKVSVAGGYEDLLKKAEDRPPLGDVIIVHATK